MVALEAALQDFVRASQDHQIGPPETRSSKKGFSPTVIPLSEFKADILAHKFKTVEIPMKKLLYTVTDGSNLKEGIRAERLKEEKMLAEADSGHARDNGAITPQRDNIVIRSLGDELAIEYPSINFLIDEFLPPGEGAMICAPGGVGKTHFITSMACNLAVAENILKWNTPAPAKVLIYQSEIPAPFYQQRLLKLYESYKVADEERARAITENVFVADVRDPFRMSARHPQASEVVGEDVEKFGIDIVIIDPFLSFFEGNENDNNEVRLALDRIKHDVAEKLKCGLIITDHKAKPPASSVNSNEQAMRGASAKRDWAASVLLLNKTKTPEGQHGDFIQATVDKLRYGRVPRDPFTLRRDAFSFRHQLYRANDIKSFDLARVLDDAGGNLSFNKFKEEVKEALTVSDADARSFINRAVENGFVKVEAGPRNSKIHNLTRKYQEQQNEK